MPQWVAFTNRRQHLTMAYKDVVSGVITTLGDMHRSTANDDLILHVVAKGEPGDLIKLPDGTELQVLPKAHA